MSEATIERLAMLARSVVIDRWYATDEPERFYPTWDGLPEQDRGDYRAIVTAIRAAVLANDPVREAARRLLLIEASEDETMTYAGWIAAWGDAVDHLRTVFAAEGGMAAVADHEVRLAVAERYISAWEVVEDGIVDWHLYHDQIAELRAAQAAYHATVDGDTDEGES